MKQCNKCNEVKPMETFSVMKASPDGRQRSCKACDKVRLQADWRDNSGSRRNSRYKLAYGIDTAAYNDMLADQDGKCKICR